MSEIWQMGAGEIAWRIRRREVSSRQVVQSHLHRIEAVNPTLNAVTVVLADSALAAADAADRTLAAGGEVGPLCGVPFTVKESVALCGSATTHGLRWLRDAVSMHDAPHVAELRAAGAIPIARTNLPELGMRWHTDNALHGATRNPWDASLTPGGSSGGEAAALAAGLTPLGVGSDGAGSLRWPAQCCGIAALKPSHGRIAVVGSTEPPQPVPGAFQLLAVHGPMARTVADLRLAFRYMCGRSSADPWHVVAPLEGPLLPTPIRVAMLADSDALPVHPHITGAVQWAARALGAAGYVVEARTPPLLERGSQIYTQTMDRYGRTTPERVPPPAGLLSADFERFWALLDPAWQAAMGAPAHDLLMERASLAHAWAALMRDTPLLLAPIATRPPWRVGEDLEPSWGATWLAALRMAVIVNLLGLPAVAVPTGVTGGVPHAVQIIGPRFREDLCLAAAEAIEASRPSFTPIDPA